MDYEYSEKYKQMAEAVIDSVSELSWIRDAEVKISYEISFAEKKHSGMEVLGECKKVPEEWRLYCPYDFRIIIYEYYATGLSANQIKVLLWHELLHIGFNEKNGTLEYRVNPHDVEDFNAIIDQFGTRWAMLGAVLPDITKGGG